MDANNEKYIPPLVSMNKLKQHFDCKKTLNETNLSIGGYIRISTKKDSQLTSIDNQKKYIKEWADVNGYNVVCFYTDVKSGAYAYLRNEMNQLVEDIKVGEIRGIVSKEISRTSRDIMDILELKRRLASMGAFFISIKESYDSRTDDDEFLLVIHAGLAQKERKTTSSRVKITQLIKAKEGKTNVTSPAYGYILSQDKQQLVIEPQTSAIYKQIVDKFLEGWGQLKICKWLNSQGILAKRGGKWNTNSIKTILSNPVYLGITIYNATTLIRDSEGKQRRVVRSQEEWVVRYNTHEPLITEETFNKIQDIIKARKEKDTKEWSCDKKYLLSGFLYCDVCKGKVYGSKVRNYYSYVCQNRYSLCDTKTKYWNMQRIDDLLMQEIRKFFKDKQLIEERIKSKQYLYNKNMVDERVQREKLINSLNKVSNAIRKQHEAYENDIISLEEYKNRMNELRQQKNDISVKLEILSKKLERVDTQEERFNQIRDKVMNMIENMDKLDISIKEALLKKIVKRAYIKSEYSLRIEYTFE